MTWQEFKSEIDTVIAQLEGARDLPVIVDSIRCRSEFNGPGDMNIKVELRDDHVRLAVSD